MSATKALEALQALGIGQNFLHPEHDRCYCRACSGTAQLPEVMESGSGLYELPLGYCGFALKLPPRAESLGIFSKWHVSYHGLK